MKEQIRQSLKRIDALSGAEEFKQYIRELEAMRPLLVRWNAGEHFPVRHPIFAIDPGNGCSTVLELFEDYIASSGLYQEAKKHQTHCLAEKTLEFSEHSSVNMKTVLTELKEEIDQISPGVIGIHIEDWLERLDSAYFKELLNYCGTLSGQDIFVFIVPYLDEAALEKVRKRINDVLNTVVIRFPAYTDGELRKAASEKLSEFGIRMDSSAEECFSRMLVRERSSGGFYGMQTAMKLATELLLLKAKSSPDKQNPTCGILTKADFTGYFTEKDDSGISGYEQLESLIGLEEIKCRIQEFVLSIKAQKQMHETGYTGEKPCYHMMFTGNPGTGKTEVARQVGRIFRENGLLQNGDLVEVNRFDLVGEYIGQTGPKTVAVCRSALGSVLFVDEAYLLAAGNEENISRDYGAEAVGALIAEMENHRDQFVVILAGYEEDMERLCSLNPGLAGRIPHRLHFNNYSREEMFEIFKKMLKEKYEVQEEFLQHAWTYFSGLQEDFINSREFGNARFVRNLVERVKIKALLRLHEEKGVQGGRIRLEKNDFDHTVSDRDILGLNAKRKRRIGFHMED